MMSTSSSIGIIDQFTVQNKYVKFDVKQAGLEKGNHYFARPLELNSTSPYGAPPSSQFRVVRNIIFENCFLK